MSFHIYFGFNMCVCVRVCVSPTIMTVLAFLTACIKDEWNDDELLESMTNNPCYNSLWIENAVPMWLSVRWISYDKFLGKSPFAISWDSKLYTERNAILIARNFFFFQYVVQYYQQFENAACPKSNSRKSLTIVWATLQWKLK